jgi:hypothetical protein
MPGPESGGIAGKVRYTGSGLIWQGERAAAPANPQLNWAYYNTVDKTSYIGKTLHLILDNYSTHTSKETTEYLQGEKVKDRFALHFIPTHSSWLNLNGSESQRKI